MLLNQPDVSYRSSRRWLNATLMAWLLGPPGEQGEALMTRRFYWMRERAHWADSAMSGSAEAESRVSSSQILK
jgi:hypothetical protein